MEIGQNRKSKTQAIKEKSKQEVTDLLCKMSHEIRTPMNGIIGLTDLLLHEPSHLNQDQTKYLKTIFQSANQLQKMLNNFLDLSKAESGRRGLVVKPIDVASVIQQAGNLFQAAAISKGLRVLVECDPELSNWRILSDELCLTQILNNLVSNSMKFTERGFVKISTKHKILSENQIELTISVQDTGVGISPEDCKKLFEKFFVVENSAGTGLGLPIVKNLVATLGGEINFSSELGKGSVFWFTFSPMIEPSNYDPPPKEVQTPRSGETIRRVQTKQKKVHNRILVAEDNSVNQQVIVAYLKKLGFEVDVAINGKDAIEMASKNNYDLILMDCLMPICDGYKSTEEIRKFNKTIPIIALTADVLDYNTSRCTQVGMCDFLSKPITKANLVEVLSRWVNIHVNFLTLMTSHTIKHIKFDL